MFTERIAMNTGTWKWRRRRKKYGWKNERDTRICGNRLEWRRKVKKKLNRMFHVGEMGLEFVRRIEAKRN